MPNSISKVVPGFALLDSKTPTEPEVSSKAQPFPSLKSVPTGRKSSLKIFRSGNTGSEAHYEVDLYLFLYLCTLYIC